MRKKVDKEMKSLIAELNNVGLITTSSCSGHGRPITGNIRNYAYIVIKMDNIAGVDINREILIDKYDI